MNSRPGRSMASQRRTVTEVTSVAESKTKNSSEIKRSTYLHERRMHHKPRAAPAAWRCWPRSAAQIIAHESWRCIPLLGFVFSHVPYWHLADSSEHSTDLRFWG